MAIVDDTEPAPPKGPSMILQIALLAGLTVVALGIGWGSGMYLSSSQAPVEPEEPQVETVKATEASLAEAQEALGVVYLEPITTNMAGPTGTWVRLEAAIVFDGPTDMLIAQMIQQDVVAYLRTVKVHQIEGASGFQHLRSDLEERARLRSGGKVSRVLVRTLLFE